MQVNTVFFTIQGEGKNIGKPSIFLRLSGCNLRCIWCDTKYTWMWSEQQFNKLQMFNDAVHPKETEPFNRNQESIEMSVSEVARKILEYPCNHIVITGGEPLLQWDEIFELTNLLKNHTLSLKQMVLFFLKTHKIINLTFLQNFPPVEIRTQSI